MYGSSPRVRGTRKDGKAAPRLHRFIPACAGNTASALVKPCSRTVHPRVCGEHLPRGRGGGAERRFIPACAGNTQPDSETLR